MSKYWFKPKKYGWGIGFPTAWQGWLAILCLVILILISAYINNIYIYSLVLKDVLRFVLDTIILSILFIVLFKEKTDGEIRWRWGK